jgi:topoisomerase-4 subunit B
MAAMTDPVQPSPRRRGASYSAKDIEVLEGLEPVRRRPGMYIGGTDERGLHHLAAEVLDNAMDEAVAGHASRIDVELAADGTLVVHDNGRGIPVDPHPKLKGKSALEVILTTLHSGAKFSNKVYHTAGGLHGVGLSVVNALADRLDVEVAREHQLWHQSYARGKATSKLKKSGARTNRRGTTVSFHPDPEIFGEGVGFRPAILYRLVRSKAYLFAGVEIRWKCDPALIGPKDATPESDALHFPGGLADYLAAQVGERATVTPEPFIGKAVFAGDQGWVEWALAWPEDNQAFISTYCNTVPTPDGGTHEAGLRAALTKGLKAYGEFVGAKRVGQLGADDVIGGASAMLSLFIREPHFQGQTKDRLTSAGAARLVEGAVKDHFDHWLSGNRDAAGKLLAWSLDRAEERLRRRAEKEIARKSATRKQRLPGKLTDCSRNEARGTELFVVEGDSAGGSAKQARNRETQAVLPLRGKILNVASASADKLRANQELSDLVQALGCGAGERYREEALRYEKVIIMTDADVDGAHIAALLMTYFYREMPGLIDHGHLYLALPPLYRISQGGKTIYARDDAHREELLASEFSGRGKIDISRFKGLGEMPAAQLKETTMAPEGRTLLRVVVPEAETEATAKQVEALMGRKPELRFKFIQEHAEDAGELDI